MGSNHPDADLYPEATGLALDTVKAHLNEDPLKLYSGWFCPFVQRTWISLEEKNIPYQYIEVNPYHKPKSLLDLNPRGLVPTLQYDNKPLYESAVLCQFLEDAYPDHSPHLLPAGPYDKARTRIWTDFVTSRVIPSFHRFLQHQGQDGLQEKRAEFLEYLKEFTKEMDKEGPYFLGKDFSLIDVIIAPWAIRLWIFDYFKGGLGIPEQGKGGDEEEVWQRWRVWLDSVEGRDSVKKTTSEKEKYLPIYQKYAEDRAQIPSVQAQAQPTPGNFSHHVPSKLKPGQAGLRHKLRPHDPYLIYLPKSFAYEVIEAKCQSAFPHFPTLSDVSAGVQSPYVDINHTGWKHVQAVGATKLWDSEKEKFDFGPEASLDLCVRKQLTQAHAAFLVFLPSTVNSLRYRESGNACILQAHFDDIHFAQLTELNIGLSPSTYGRQYRDFLQRFKNLRAVTLVTSKPGPWKDSYMPYAGGNTMYPQIAELMGGLVLPSVQRLKIKGCVTTMQGMNSVFHFCATNSVRLHLGQHVSGKDGTSTD